MPRSEPMPGRMPWPFIDGRNVESPETPVPNLPTPEGREMGRHMARMTANDRAEIVAAGGTPPPMCGECAFREGTLANGSAAMLMNAVKCLMEGETFYCHKNLDGTGDPTRRCGGFPATAPTETTR